MRVEFETLRRRGGTCHRSMTLPINRCVGVVDRVLISKPRGPFFLVLYPSTSSNLRDLTEVLTFSLSSACHFGYSLKAEVQFQSRHFNDKEPSLPRPLMPCVGQICGTSPEADDVSS